MKGQNLTMKGYRESNVCDKLKVVFEIIVHRNSIICHDYNRKADMNRVNLNYWKLDSLNNVENLGDYLSVVVVKAMLEKENLSLASEINGKKHLYAVGSILMTGFQDCTVWGTGLLDDIRNGIEGNIAVLVNRMLRKLDVRAVRGPKTRNFLRSIGIDCPEVYGDPAILMPLFYSPNISKIKTEYLVINHYSKASVYGNMINLMTDDYKYVIDKIASSKLVITGSLHGLILAEAYGVPVILMNDREDFSLFKYEDYYQSTGRYQFPVAKSIEEALEMKPAQLPILDNLQKGLIKAFPYDLWA